MFETIFREISQMTIYNMANMGMLMLFAWFISQYAKSNTPKFMMSIIGLFFISTALKTDSILFNPSTFFGLGLLLPHLSFFVRWIADVVITLKLITFDTYYFFLTVYYKTRNIFLWFVHFYEKVQRFFYKQNNKKTYDKHYKSKGYSYQKNFNEEDVKQEQSRSYKKNDKQSTYTQSNNIHEEKKHNSKYAQFYSTSHYVVLGVSASDDMQTIKNAYRSLIKKYHADKNYDASPEELKLYTEISQLINNAYAELKKKK